MVDIVIVNFNSRDQLRSCLHAIRACPGDTRLIDRVVVIDNGSQDGSQRGLSQVLPDVILVENRSNTGFATACNAGARLGSGRFVLFLNPDTRVSPGFLERPLSFMDSKQGESTAICGVQLVDQEGTPQHTCARFPRPYNFVVQALGLNHIAPKWFKGLERLDFDHRHDLDVDHVMGAFYLVRRSVFEELEGFDERFFVYLEDLDFSLRASERGWHSRFLAGVNVFHKGGGTSEHFKAARLHYSLRSRIAYGSKHFSRTSALLIMVLTLAVEPFLRLVRAVTRMSLTELRETIDGYRLLYRDTGYAAGRSAKS